MNDRPSVKELLDAVRHYLEKELLPSLTDARQRFQTLIAANVLSIAARELVSEETMLAEEYALLAPLVVATGEWPTSLTKQRECIRALNETLCEQIRHGAYHERWREVTAIVRQLVVRKLELANPRYLQSVNR
jgi:hypothetical protein